MEEQIEELESLGPGGRTPKQEEQLRVLKLEMEFRKRAMEAAADEKDVNFVILVFYGNSFYKFQFEFGA